MSTTEKLLRRFLSMPKDFTFHEIRKLLKSYGYEEVKRGRSSGSKVAFYNREYDDMIKFHKPHPSQVMKRCYLKEIKQQLTDKGTIK